MNYKLSIQFADFRTDYRPDQNWQRLMGIKKKRKTPREKTRTEYSVRGTATL